MFNVLTIWLVTSTHNAEKAIDDNSTNNFLHHFGLEYKEPFNCVSRPKSNHVNEKHGSDELCQRMSPVLLLVDIRGSLVQAMRYFPLQSSSIIGKSRRGLKQDLSDPAQF